MSVEVRIRVQGECECGIPKSIGALRPPCSHDLVCDWGVIEHSEPWPEHGQVGHLMLATSDFLAKLFHEGPKSYRRGGVCSTTQRDGRVFAHIDYKNHGWTWELCEAHFADGKGPNGLFIGRWPD